MIGSYHFSECVGCVVQKCVVLLLDKMCRNEHLVSGSNVSYIVSQITTHATHFNLVCIYRPEIELLALHIDTIWLSEFGCLT